MPIEKRYGRFRAWYRDAAGNRFSKTFDLKGDAADWLITVKATQLAGTYVDPNAGTVSLRAWSEMWAVTEQAVLKPSSWANTESNLRVHVLPTFGELSLSQITQPMIQRWVTRLGMGRTPATVQKIYRVLTKLLDAAVFASLLPKSPTDGIKLAPADQTEMQVITSSQLLALGDAIHPRYRMFVLTMGFLGLRLGEATALRWGRVDRFGSTITVAENAPTVGGALVFGTPKSKAGKRRISVPAALMDQMKAHATTYMPDTDPSSLLFTGPQGGPVTSQAFRHRHFYPAAESIGLVDFRIHDLRHTAISLWIAAGANPKLVAVRAGHRSIVTVFDRYGHLFPDASEGLDAELDRQLGVSGVDEGTDQAWPAALTQ